MLTAILSLLGVGGIAGGLAYFVGPAAILSKLSPVAALLKAVPRQVWYTLAILAVLVVGYFYHQHRLHRHDAALVKVTIEQRDAAWRKRLDAEHGAAIAWERKYEQQGATIARLNKEKHDAQVRDNAAVAGALSVRGPGAAAADRCRQSDHPSAAAVAGGRNGAAPDADAAGPQVPAGDWAVVPWSWLVKRAQEHDDLLDTEVTRRADDDQQRAAWEKMRSAPPASSK